MDEKNITAATMLECRLCELTFDTSEEKRQHAKSEWHVYKIRCRVAEPGTNPTPPDIQPHKLSSRKETTRLSVSPSPQRDEVSHDEESDSDAASDRDIVEFVAENCLFCNQTSYDFERNLTHMHRVHSLFIPFQPSLVVDLYTLIWYLHMVIFSYRECICCGKRRRTIEAVQQHMTAAGHCRFDVSEEMSEFYDLATLPQHNPERHGHPDEYTLKLPSGKLLGHRSCVDTTPKSKPPENSPGVPAPSSIAPETGISPKYSGADSKQQALSTQLTKLRTGDQLSLMHLPESQQRSLLLARKKALDHAKRAERRKRGRLDHVGNKTTIHTKYYKQEVPIYSGG